MAKLQDLEPLAFGPVPSRRLSKSPRNKQYSTKSVLLFMCLLSTGKTSENIVERRVFYQPCDILREVVRKVDDATIRNERVDYLTFVADGEPTLDVNIGGEISILKQIGIPIAAITSADCYLG
jgi:wyosine [tRNA(Phe)-imidazoG37] synthetase (radical SAM superfamily)